MAVKNFLKEVERLKEDFRRQKASQTKRRTKSVRHDDESNWLVSYADMMTLLCGFFIMLFSLSKLDDPKYEGLKESVAKQFGGKYQAPTAQLGNYLTQVIQEAGLERFAVIRPDAYGVAIELESTVFFDTLSAELRPEGRVALQRVIHQLAQRQIKELKEFPIVVEGHTDARPIVGGTYATNWELSAARSARITRLFVEQGFRPDRLTAVGYGDARPLAPSRQSSGAWDEAALAKNRRVVLRVYRPDIEPNPAARVPAAVSAH